MIPEEAEPHQMRQSHTRGTDTPEAEANQRQSHTRGSIPEAEATRGRVIPEEAHQR